eukprot:sb/3474970/
MSLVPGVVIGLLISFEPTKTSKQPIRTRYLGHVTGYQPIRDQSVVGINIRNVMYNMIEISKQLIRTRYLGHVTGYQPIMDQYFLIWPPTLFSGMIRVHMFYRHFPIVKVLVTQFTVINTGIVVFLVKMPGK